MRSPRTETLETARATLDRHDRRRRNGRPTVTVLAGSPLLAWELWNGWAVATKRWPVHTECRASYDMPEILCAIIESDANRGVQAVARKVGAVNKLDVDQLFRDLPMMTQADATPLWEAAWLGGLDDPAGRIAFSLVRGEPLAKSCRNLFGAGPHVLAMCCHAFATIFGPLDAPVLLLEADGRDMALGAGETATGIAEAWPELALGITLDPAWLSMVIGVTPRRRWADMLREGVVMLPVEQTTTAVVGVPVPPPRSPSQTTKISPPNAARSLAEERLRRLLEGKASLAGLFQLNKRLPIHFGRLPYMEVDFVCDSLRIAVEVDGFYHFQSPEHYRRDRQKDALLQEAGWLVLRFLADDVMERLGSVTGSIDHAVRLRRSALEGQGV